MRGRVTGEDNKTQPAEGVAHVDARQHDALDSLAVVDAQAAGGTDRYDDETARLHESIVVRHGAGAAVLDVGCGTGRYFMAAANAARHAVGVDFSANALRVLVSRCPSPNAGVVRANIRALPLRASSFDMVFSFSTLWVVPAVEEVVFECHRVLKPAGIAIFEFGNYWSLHTIIYRHSRFGLRYFHVPTRAMRRMVRAAGFEVLSWRAFQALPLMGGGPWWLRPLTMARWRKLLQLRVGSRMLDEIFSSAWPIRPFAFRHIVVCRKPR
jgi:SAM-dependent methyltransferase